MNENEVDDYAAWLDRRRAVSADDKRTDRIMAAIEGRSADSPGPSRAVRSAQIAEQVGPILLWTAASLIFVARISSLVGNLVFPTESYPEFAADHRNEERTHEHRSESRS